MYKKNGYKFISLTEALKNPAQPLNVLIQDLHETKKPLNSISSVIPAE